jgi:hypothetical protein
MTGAETSPGSGRQQLPKCPTGIHGLDEVTGGGLPRGRPTLVCGRPGCGKTLLAVPRGGGKGVRYGLGVQILESEWGPSYGHGGWFPGYRTEVEYFPKHRVAVAMQFNTDVGRALKKGLRAYIGDVAGVVLAPGE